MDKKTLSVGLIAISVIAVLLAGVDYFGIGEAPLGLGANSWMAVGIALGIYGNFAKQA